MSIHGWCACYNFNTTTLNCGIPTGSLKVLTNGFNVYSDKYLTNSVGTYSYGTILGPYDDGLTYEYGYPNSWRITTATNTLGTLRYGKGWYLATGNN